MKTTFTWYGHATLGLTVGEHKLLVDPFFTGNPVAPITADEAFADFILITHGHGDHVGDAQAIAKRNNALIISNFEIAGWFAEQGLNPTLNTWAVVFITPLAISSSLWHCMAPLCLMVATVATRLACF